MARKYQQFDLDRHIPFLFAKANLKMHQKLKPESTEPLQQIASITKNQARVISIIASNNPVLPSNIAEVVALDRAVVTRSIAELLQKNLVQLMQSQKDRRNKLVTLTKKGEALCEQLFAVMDDFGSHLDSALTPSEKKSLLKILDKLDTATDSYNI